MNKKNTHNHMKERQQTMNAVNNQKRKALGLDDYNTSVKKKEKVKNPTPSFHKNKGFILFKKSYIIILLMTLALIINTIARGFLNNYSYIFVNMSFIIIFFITNRFVNPINFASDNKNYIYGNFNSFYITFRDDVTNLLSRIGDNLNVKPRNSLIYSFSITVIGSIFSILFYNSNFEILALPFLLIYIARVVSANSFKDDVMYITLFKWILFGLLMLNSVLSVIWFTPFDYTLFVIISIYNSLGIWMRNTYIYTTGE